MDSLGVLWLVILLLSLLVTVVTFGWLFIQIRGIWQALKSISVPYADTEDITVSPRLPAPTLDKNTISAARISRKSIKLKRGSNRAARLARARKRWAEHGLANDSALIGSLF